MNLIDEAFVRAKDVLHMNVTERGFSACSIGHDDEPTSNYRSVWARDSAMTLIWALPLDEAEFTSAARRSLETILSHQTREGHIPNYVDVASGHPEFGGVGNIAGIDSALWVVIASGAYVDHTQDMDFLHHYLDALELTMFWLRAHDTNNCGLLEVPEAADWTDLFPRSYNVLYDEVLWYRANVVMGKLLALAGRHSEEYINRAARIRHLINDQFWPTPETASEGPLAFSRTQFNLGRTRYLLAQITPFGFSWRCDAYANIIASLYGVLDDDRAQRVREFLRQISIDHPAPVRVLYPSIRPGDPDWRDYFLVNLQNLPDHYHNGGIWPFVGGLWVRFLDRLEKHDHANEALQRLAEVCHAGIDAPWEFTEWAHGVTGRPMGKAYQAWSAASYVAAYLRFQGDTSFEVETAAPEELLQAKELGLPAEVAEGELDLDVQATGPAAESAADSAEEQAT